MSPLCLSGAVLCVSLSSGQAENKPGGNNKLHMPEKLMTDCAETRREPNHRAGTQLRNRPGVDSDARLG